MDNNFQKNIIIVGLTGSGKDTIADDLVYNSDYFKLRIAGTIKQIICEKHELSETELEEVKRTNPVIRQEHHDIGNEMDSFNGTSNRVKLIISGKLGELKYKQNHQQIVVTDGRSLTKEVKQFLDNSEWCGIFLSRNNYDKEYKNDNHWTDDLTIEKSLNFINDNNFFGQSIIIINDKELYSLDEKYIEIASKCLGYFNISEDSSKINLLSVIKHCVENELI